MKKDISILVDYEENETFTNFDEDSVTAEDLILAVAHISIILMENGFDINEIFDTIIETLQTVEPIEEDNEYILLN